MAIASGLGSQVGLSAETTYGTYVAPTRFIESTKVSVKKVKNTVTTAGIAAGRMMQAGSRRVVTTKGGTGTLEHELVNRGMGLLVQALMGTTVTPVQQASTTAYLQTHTLADTRGKSLTLQSGIPDATGTVRPYSFLGGKVAAGEFTFEVDKEVTVTWDLDFRDVVESESLAAASYTGGLRPFVGTDTSIKVGTYSSESSVSGVKKVSVKIDRGLNMDRYYLGAGGLKAEPLMGNYTAITGTITADLVDKTVFADRFASDAAFSVVLEAVGPVIESTYYHTFRITLPQCYLDGDTPTIEGTDVVSGDFPFVALFDGTNLPKIEIISTDTAV